MFYVSVFVIWLYLQKAMYRPCNLDLWPMKDNLFLVNWLWLLSVLYEFQIDIHNNSREIKYRNIEIWVYTFYMLNVAHVKKNYVKWRPTVTKFGTLMESRAGLCDCHIFQNFVDDFIISCTEGSRLFFMDIEGRLFSMDGAKNTCLMPEYLVGLNPGPELLFFKPSPSPLPTSTLRVLIVAPLALIKVIFATFE